MSAVCFKSEQRTRTVLYGTVGGFVFLLLSCGPCSQNSERRMMSERRFWSKMCHVHKSYRAISSISLIRRLKRSAPAKGVSSQAFTIASA